MFILWSVSRLLPQSDRRDQLPTYQRLPHGTPVIGSVSFLADQWLKRSVSRITAIL